MTIARKLMIVTAGVLAVALLGPIVITTLSPGGKRYFEDGRCACSYDSYIFLEGDGYFTYTPAHVYPARRAFNLRLREDQFGMLALGDQSGGRYLSLGPAEGTVAGHLRIQDGALWEQWAGKTNWTRHARIYNPWPIWLAKLRAEPLPKINCVNNLKQIGLASRQWALDNGSQFPSTSARTRAARWSFALSAATALTRIRRFIFKSCPTN